ncbi:hypothetical protein [Streptomyces sp. NPDC002676]
MVVPHIVPPVLVQVRAGVPADTDINADCAPAGEPLLTLGYPDPDKQYTSPISRFDADQLFTYA